jgi:GNAT superfamily N-acetyltransferase
LGLTWNHAVALDRDATTNLRPSVVGLVVIHDYRRKGIATTLLESAEDRARELGYSRVYLSTSVLSDLLHAWAGKR